MPIGWPSQVTDVDELGESHFDTRCYGSPGNEGCSAG